MPDCKICKEWYWTENHTCAPEWYCVHADDYEDPVKDAGDIRADGWKIFALTAEKAAIKFAEVYQSHNSWYPEEMDVFVMNEKEDKIWKYVVNMETMPEYSVWYGYKPETYALKND